MVVEGGAGRGAGEGEGGGGGGAGRGGGKGGGGVALRPPPHPPVLSPPQVSKQHPCFRNNPSCFETTSETQGLPDYHKNQAQD